MIYPYFDKSVRISANKKIGYIYETKVLHIYNSSRINNNTLKKAGKYYYRLKQIDNNGNYKYSSSAYADYVVPSVYSLNQNYPNPFNPTTVISWSVPLASNVKITIYNSIGEEIRVIENEFKEAGNYESEINASSFSSGVYFYRLEAGTFSQVRKMMVLK